MAEALGLPGHGRGHLEKAYVQNKLELTKHISDAVRARKQFYGSDGWYAWWYVAPDEAEYHSRLEHMDPPSEHAEALVDVVISTFQTRPFSWVTGPQRQVNLEYLLESRCFSLQEEAAVMAVRLSNMAPLFPAGIPHCLQIVPVTSPRGVKTWVETWTHKASKLAIEDWTHIYTRLLKSLPVSQFCMFVAMYSGHAVGTVYIHCYGGSASLHAVDVLPAFRRQGIGRALTAFAMNEARNRGCGFCTLTSSALSRDLFDSLGFKEFGNVKEYRLDLSRRPPKGGDEDGSDIPGVESRGNEGDTEEVEEEEDFESIDKDQTLRDTKQDAENDGWCYI